MESPLLSGADAENAPGYRNSVNMTRRQRSWLILLVSTLVVLVVAMAIALVAAVVVGGSEAGNGSGDGNGASVAPSDRISPFDHLKDYCKDIPEISREERADRRLALSQALARGGSGAVRTDWLLVEPGASLQYLTGIQWSLSERPFVAVIKRSSIGLPLSSLESNGGVQTAVAINTSSTIAFVCPAFESRRAAEVLTESLGMTAAEVNSTLFLWQEHEPWQTALVRALGLDSNSSGSGPGGDSGNASARVLAFDRDVRYFVAESAADYLDSFGVRVAAHDVGGSIIDSLRSVKSIDELALLRCANIATKAVLAAVRATMAVGDRESSVTARVADALAVAGFTSTWSLVLFGPDASFPHGTNQDRVLADSEMVLLDIGGSMKGYQSDISRTYVFGSTSETQQRAYAAVRDAQRAALDAIRPNVSCAFVDSVARQVIADAGFGANYQYFAHRLGHGIGLQGHEAPYLVRGNNDTLLVPGMTFSVEPGIYAAGEYGIRLEDIVAVTETGVETFGELAP